MDCLPDIEACDIHGIGPQTAIERGMKESDFAQKVLMELGRPGTCNVAYNGMKFDHAVSQFLFYRNLYDPYAWHWRERNTRWDTLDLMRAAYVMKPDTMNWHINDYDNTPSFKLEKLALANGQMQAGEAHDAMADVQAMLGLARIVYRKEPTLFKYYTGLADKKKVSFIMHELFVLVNGAIPYEQNMCAPMFTFGRPNKDATMHFTFNLEYDPSPYMEMTEEELSHAMFSPEREYCPIHMLRSNRCPFVIKGSGAFGAYIKSQSNNEGYVIDVDKLAKHHLLLQQHGLELTKTLDSLHSNKWGSGRSSNVDTALYDGFAGDKDKSILTSFRTKDPTLSNAASIKFQDDRIPELLYRFRARNFPETLSPEQWRWWKCLMRYNFDKMLDDGNSTIQDYIDRVESKMKEAATEEDSNRYRELYNHAVALLELSYSPKRSFGEETGYVTELLR